MTDKDALKNTDQESCAKTVRSRNGHRRNRNTDVFLILLPLVPIVALLLLILLLDRPAEESAVTPEETTAVRPLEIETEATLSAEEEEDLERRNRILESTKEYTEFGVLLSDGSINFRSTPDSSGSGNKIGQINDLDVCDRLATEGEWYRVRYNGKTGYIYSSYCTDGEKGKAEARILLGKEGSESLSDPVVVHTEGNEVRIFSEPRSNDMSLVIGRISSGAELDILEESGDWYRIRSGPVEGYIPRERCAVGEEAVKIAEVKANELCEVKAETLCVRSAPSYGEGSILRMLKAGDTATVSERLSDDDGETGWVEVTEIFESDDDRLEMTGYLNAGGGNAELRLGLKTAEEADAKELVLEDYEEPIVCITNGYVNIRESTTTGSYTNIVGKIYPGNGAELLGTVEAGESKDGNKWYRISSGGVTGYVSAGTSGESWFALGEDAREIAPAYAKLTAKITADCLNVRSSPSKENDDNVWTQVTRGQAYEVLEQQDDWVKIDLGSDENENEAYISKNESFIRISYGLEEAIEFSYEEKANAFRQSVVDYACQFIGNPYVWGGNSLTKGCDCSGFVQQIMKKYGISMERASYYQAKQGVKRTSSTMRVGDLIFYAGSNGVVNHVGIYIGGGYMVGAQSRRSGIKVVRWNYRTPVAIRDVIGDRIE